MKGKIVSILTVISLFLGLLTLQFAIGAFSKRSKSDSAQSARLKGFEEKLSKLSIKTLNGSELKISNVREPLILVNFWATWCVPCVREFESMKKMEEKLGKDKVKIIGINCDEDTPKSKILSFINKHNLDFPITLDPNHKILDDFGLENLPASLVYNHKNIVYFSNRYTNFMNEDFIKKLKLSLK